MPRLKPEHGPSTSTCMLCRGLVQRLTMPWLLMFPPVSSLSAWRYRLSVFILPEDLCLLLNKTNLQRLLIAIISLMLLQRGCAFFLNGASAPHFRPWCHHHPPWDEPTPPCTPTISVNMIPFCSLRWKQLRHSGTRRERGSVSWNLNPAASLPLSLALFFILFIATYLFLYFWKTDQSRASRRAPRCYRQHPQSQLSAWKPGCVYVVQRAVNLLIFPLCWQPLFFCDTILPKRRQIWKPPNTTRRQLWLPRTKDKRSNAEWSMGVSFKLLSSEECVQGVIQTTILLSSDHYALLVLCVALGYFVFGVCFQPHLWSHAWTESAESMLINSF